MHQIDTDLSIDFAKRLPELNFMKNVYSALRTDVYNIFYGYLLIHYLRWRPRKATEYVLTCSFSLSIFIYAFCFRFSTRIVNREFQQYLEAIMGRMANAVVVSHRKH